MATHLPLLQQLTAIDLSEEQASSIEQALAAEPNWSSLLAEAELYAISNLFLRHVKAHQWSIPVNVKLQLRALALRHQHAADARYQVMHDLVDAFAEHHLPMVALKGLALAPMVYPSDDLRPMRDIDILVPKDSLQQAATILRELGFNLPEQQPTRYMRDTHQLPNATLEVNGFTISVEIHHDALSRDVPGSLFFDEVADQLQTVKWRELKFNALNHSYMLHQVARHLAGLHPGAVLKMINVLDVVLYAEKFKEQIDWTEIRDQYAHVINTLKCLHLIVPLSDQLQAKIGKVAPVALTGVGETMQPLSAIFTAKNGFKQKLNLLFSPPDWWMHLYYNVGPNDSLIWVRLVRHPLQVANWLAKRAYSGILGG